MKITLNKSVLKTCCLSLAAVALPLSAIQAATTTNIGDFSIGHALITFDEFAQGTNGTLQTGGATITADSSLAFVRPQAFTQAPGIFEGQYFGQGASGFTVQFDSAQKEAGLGLFDPNFQGTKIQALDANGGILEELLSPLGPPGGTFSSFLGFLRSEGDIRGLRVIPAAADLIAIDNIRYSAADISAVPVPASLPLALFGFGALGWLSRRRKS